MKIELKDLKEQPTSIRQIASALGKVLTVGEFAKLVRERTGNDKISNQTIHHHLKKTDNLDYIEWCGIYLIVQNKKAEDFTPGEYYGEKNVSVTSFDKKK
jgi:DNA-binding transcriptional ArsR family regulator